MVSSSEVVFMPAGVQARVEGWQEEFGGTLSVEEMQPYSGHSMFSLTVGAQGANATDKKGILITVPHAHEPAGTAACMNLLSWLLTGRTLDGRELDLERDVVLDHCVVTAIPDGNPFGRERLPEKCVSPENCTCAEGTDIMLGFQRDGRTRLRRDSYFDAAIDQPVSIGVIWEQMGETEYMEPNRELKCTVWRLAERELVRRRYHQLLCLHQHEGIESVWIAEDVPASLLDYENRWAQRILNAWSAAGIPHGPASTMRGKYPSHMLAEKYSVPTLAPEIMMGRSDRERYPNPIEAQARSAETAIIASIELLLE